MRLSAAVWLKASMYETDEEPGLGIHGFSPPQPDPWLVRFFGSTRKAFTRHRMLDFRYSIK